MNAASALVPLVPVQIDGWTLYRESANDWIHDLDLAERARLKNRHDIRAHIKKAASQGAVTILAAGENGPTVDAQTTISGDAGPPAPLVRVELTSRLIGSGARRVVEEFFLSRDAAVTVLLRLRTPEAKRLQRTLVPTLLRVFELAQRGRLATTSHPPRDVTDMLEERLTRFEERILALVEFQIRAATAPLKALPGPQRRRAAAPRRLPPSLVAPPVVEEPSPAESQLRGALEGLGWRRADIARAVTGLGAQVETLALPDLVRNAIRYLTPPRAAAAAPAPRPVPEQRTAPRPPERAAQQERPSPPRQRDDVTIPTEYGRAFMAAVERWAAMGTYHARQSQSVVLVARALARKCDSYGQVVIGLRVIAEYAPCSVPTVPRAIALLNDCGFLEYEPDQDRTGAYRLLLPNRAAPTPAGDPGPPPPTKGTDTKHRGVPWRPGMRTPREEKFALACELIYEGANHEAAARGAGVTASTLRRALNELPEERTPLPPPTVAHPLGRGALPRLKRQVLRRILREQGFDTHRITKALDWLGTKVEHRPLDELLREAFQGVTGPA